MLPNYLEDLCETWEPVGSRVTCNPPPMDTDQDILVLLTKEQWPVFLEELELNKWEKCVGEVKEWTPAPLVTNYATTELWYIAYQAWCELREGLAEAEKSYGDIGDGASFEAWRLGELNLILTMDEFWYDKFMEASDCCKALNVMDKQERIDIFNKIVPKSKTVTKKPQQQPLWGSLAPVVAGGNWPDLAPAINTSSWHGEWTVTGTPTSW